VEIANVRHRSPSRLILRHTGTPQDWRRGVRNLAFVRSCARCGRSRCDALKDALQNPILQLAQSKLLTVSVNFEAFGNPTSQSGTPPAIGFTGAQTDPETGFVYLHARYYDPTTGRFLSRDPRAPNPADPGDQNAYVYAKNDPTRYTDPSGRDTFDPASVSQGGASGCDNGGCNGSADTNTVDGSDSTGDTSGSSGSSSPSNNVITTVNNGDVTAVVGCFLGVCKVVGYIVNGVRQYVDTLGYMASQVDWICQIPAVIVAGVTGVVAAAGTAVTGPGDPPATAIAVVVAYGVTWGTCRAAGL
jgi:RHS repeat-associated protein